MEPSTIFYYTESAGFPLIWLAGLIFSVAILRSKTFGKAAATIGIVGFPLLLWGVPFARYTSGPAAGSALETAVIATSIIGGLLSMVWYILVGLKLLFRFNGSQGDKLSRLSSIP